MDVSWRALESVGAMPVRRLLARVAWQDRPEVLLHYQVATDALIVELLPLAAGQEIVLHDDLCLFFDAADNDGLPTTCCLVGFAAAPDGPAARTARAFVGEFLWRCALELDLSRDSTAIVLLDHDECHERLRAWNRRDALSRPEGNE